MKVVCLILTLLIRAWFVMLAWAAVARDIDVPSIGYPTALIVAIGVLGMSTTVTYGRDGG